MTKKDIYPVRFVGLRGSTDCDATFRTENSERWQRWLRYARANKATTIVTCLCLPAEDEPVRRRMKVNRSQRTDQCWLSSYSYTGHEHAPDCRYYSVWPDERQAAIYTADVLKIATDGSLVVRLPIGLQKKEQQNKTSAEPPEKSGTSSRRRRHPSMQLAGLLHLLWERSGINVWHPAFDKKKRTPGWVSWKLSETAASIRIGKYPLQDSLLLMSMTRQPQAEKNWQHIRMAEKKSRRFILISQLAVWSDDAEVRLQHTLPLGLFAGFPALQVPEDVMVRLSRSYARELADWRRGAKVIVICEAEPPETTFTRQEGRNIPHSTSKVIDVALMTVSPRYIPLDSGYEGMVEERLWQEKRAFIKPLRYDGEAEVFPDFVLTDMPGVDALPMEVFGMKTPGYLQRKQEKIKHYDQEYGPGKWWQWDAADCPDAQDIPSFPARKSEISGVS
ncbi:DUF1173 family protein [Citrobacter sp. RHB35-C17]|uniref:DUF1173 family protein n=1 Tax=Citrobacter sp. RHB35-C17 TaxID=2742625 RepID=UPI0015EAF487|nr:DUF1173 family protein [Citrobacter sp. RHB35-C17]QMD64662.1 DUF1173 family protein [Citrobacter sp. RHB35-C17]HBL7007469.1 DUF1173 family protein [Citrobacter koseri]